MSSAVRWAIKSVAGLVANLALLTVWVDGLGLAAWWAVGINWLLISMVGYAVTDRWVYPNGDSPSSARGIARRYLSLQGVMTTSKAANYVIFVGLLSVVDYRVAWAVGAVVTFGVSYAGSQWLWTGKDTAVY